MLGTKNEESMVLHSLLPSSRDKTDLKKCLRNLEIIISQSVFFHMHHEPASAAIHDIFGIY